MSLTNFCHLLFMIVSFHHTDLTDMKYSGHRDQPLIIIIIITSYIVITKLKLYRNNYFHAKVSDF